MNLKSKNIKLDSANPAPINSSYVVMFHLALIAIAPMVLNLFPDGLKAAALVTALIFPFTLFWFSYAIKQFLNVSVAMILILAAAYIIALLSTLNAMYGQLSTHAIPVFYSHLFLFDSLLAGLSGPPGLIYAGTILAYGAYVYIFSLALANVFELAYEKLVKPILPQRLRQELSAIDTNIDNHATVISDKFFAVHQSVGALICLALISIYALIFGYLLIK